MSTMLGLGSYVYRWSIGMHDRVPQTPMRAGELLDEARRLGLSLVQFADNLPLHTLSAAELSSLHASAQAAGITLEIGQQGADMALFERYLDIADALDASLLRMALDAADGQTSQGELESSFAAAAAQAGKRGVTLALENHFGFPSERLARLVATVDSPHLGVCLDVANSICAGEWPAETIERLAPHTVNLHLKDYDILPDPYGVGFRIAGVPLGEGRTDIEWVLKQVGRSGRACNVVLEHWLPGDAPLEELARRERDWIERSVRVARERVPTTA